MTFVKENVEIWFAQVKFSRYGEEVPVNKSLRKNYRDDIKIVNLNGFISILNVKNLYCLFI